MISHAYFGIDYEMLWEILRSDLPQNITEIRRIIEAEKGSLA